MALALGTKHTAMRVTVHFWTVRRSFNFEAFGEIVTGARQASVLAHDQRRLRDFGGPGRIRDDGPQRP